jgi:hypothetical protein
MRKCREKPSLGSPHGVSLRTRVEMPDLCPSSGSAPGRHSMRSTRRPFLTEARWPQKIIPLPLDFSLTNWSLEAQWRNLGIGSKRTTCSSQSNRDPLRARLTVFRPAPPHETNLKAGWSRRGRTVRSLILQCEDEDRWWPKNPLPSVRQKRPRAGITERPSEAGQGPGHDGELSVVPQAASAAGAAPDIEPRADNAQ